MAVSGTTKKTFTKDTLLECECMEEHTQDRYQGLEKQATLKWEVMDLTIILNNKELAISKFKSEL